MIVAGVPRTAMMLDLAAWQAPTGRSWATSARPSRSPVQGVRPGSGGTIKRPSLAGIICAEAVP